MRPAPLLLAAALAVAVPGFLITGCTSQTTAAPDRTTAAGRTPAAAPAAPRRQASAQAAQLLTQAAQAAVATSYTGEEIVSHWGTSGGSVLVSNIWHVSGGQTITQTLAAGTATSGGSYLSSDSDGQWPEGVLGVTTPLIRLLEAHYTVAYAGPGSADNRSAQVVEAWRADGSLAALFWLDDATKLPLEREVFDSAAHVISEDVFINVRFANGGLGTVPVGLPADPAGPWADPQARPAPHADCQRLAGPVRAARGAVAVHRRPDQDQHRDRARPWLLRRPVGHLGVRTARQPGAQAGRLAEGHGGRAPGLRGRI